MTDISHLSAAETGALYARKELSPVEVVRTVLDRVAAWEPKINAMYLVHRDAAVLAAQASERRWESGRPLSRLDGVPVTLKENIATRGDPMPMGTAATVLVAKLEDSPVAARLRESGAVLIGKTTMPDFGMLSSGVSSYHGVTRSAWDQNRNPSGSSSGAAAAAVAGYGPLHIGTDIGGSVRLPAVHAGIFALKPSLGRVPVYPPYMGRVAGPMTRSVTDAALAMEVLARPDVRDFMSLPESSAAYVDELDNSRLDLDAIHIGYLPTMGCGLPPVVAVADAVGACVEALAAAGARVTRMESFLTDAMLDGASRFFEARACADISAMSAAARDKILPFILEWATWRAAAFTGNDVMSAYGQIMAMRDAAVRAVAAFDFVISPTSPILPYDAEDACPGNDPHDALPHIAFTVPYNMSEQPAASVNWSFTPDGAPLGLQVIGQRFDDLGVLQLAHAIEKLRPAQRAWPKAA